jgi:hypothetical protein
MSNPTTPFSWQMPTATDLVTDLPADFEVFGQAVATSMADLLGGTTGQILAKNSATDMDFVWIANDQGDITGITATSPLTGGGTSGAVTVGIQDALTTQKGAVQLSDSTSTTSSILAATPTAVKASYDLAAAAIPKSTVTTNGDLIYGTGSATVSRIGVGSTGQVLTVAAGVPAWAAPTSGLVFISRSSFSAVSSVSANNVFTSTYDNYKLMIQITGISANDAEFFVRTRASGTDRATNYNTGVAAVDRSNNVVQYAGLDLTAGYKLGEFDGGETAQNYAFEVDLMYPTSNTRQQVFIKSAFISQSNVFTYGAGGGSRTTGGAADGFTLRSSAGTFTGTCDIYGLAKS